MYSVIWVSAVSGCSDDVIDTARAAGAKGGTVLHGRRRSSEKAQQHLGLPMQEEQEFIMIVVEKEKKCTVMKALNEACGVEDAGARGDLILARRRCDGPGMSESRCKQNSIKKGHGGCHALFLVHLSQGWGMGTSSRSTLLSFSSGRGWLSMNFSKGQPENRA